MRTPGLDISLSMQWRQVGGNGSAIAGHARVVQADWTIVMDHGKIAEIGSHDELPSASSRLTEHAGCSIPGLWIRGAMPPPAAKSEVGHGRFEAGGERCALVVACVRGEHVVHRA